MVQTTVRSGKIIHSFSSIRCQLSTTAMLEPRKQGRPTRNSGVNGRDALIEATRAYLRSKSKITITRSEIAQGCGVTPALISYYFKGKTSLIEAVTKPLVRSYNQKLIIINNTFDSASLKIKSIIRLLIEMHIDDAFLIEYLMQEVGLSKLDDEDRAVTDLFRDTLSDLISELMADGQWRPMDLTRTRLCLWASCRIMGETHHVQAKYVEPNTFNRADAVNQSAEFIYEVFTNPGPADKAWLAENST